MIDFNLLLSSFLVVPAAEPSSSGLEQVAMGAVLLGGSVLASRKLLRKTRRKLIWESLKSSILGKKYVDRRATTNLIIVILGIALGAVLITFAGWWGVAGALALFLLILILMRRRRRDPYRRINTF